MEDITGIYRDFKAVGVAHNLLSALIDNQIDHGNELDIEPPHPRKRVVDMNDRALRNIVVGMGGPANGYLREDGYYIVVASGSHGNLCLATSRADLKERLGRIVIGYKSYKVTPVYARDLNAEGSMAALLKNVIKLNLDRNWKTISRSFMAGRSPISPTVGARYATNCAETGRLCGDRSGLRGRFGR